MPWTFLSSHGIVLLVIARDTAIRIRDIAERVGITERAVHRIVSDLIASGYLTRNRIGRRNVYEVHADMHMRHPTTDHLEVGDLMKLLRSPPPEET